MTEHSYHFNPQKNPTVPILLIGCDDASSQPWRQACDRLKLQVTSLEQSSDCRAYIAAHGGACIVATTWPKVDATMLNASDEAFKRSTVILVSKEKSELDLWQSICWDNYYDPVSVETAVEALKAGTLEAMQRRDDWNLVEAFHHQQAALNDDELLVMISICRGLLNKKIASNFGVSIRTIEQRRRHVFEKMKVDSVAPLATMVAKVHEIERRGIRRNSPGLKRNRFWKNWDAAHTMAQNPPHTDANQESALPKKGPNISIDQSKNSISRNNQLGS